MELYGNILLIAMPIFLVLVLFEKWYGWKKGKNTVEHMDMISSLTSGVTNVTKDVLGIAVALISYEWLVDKIAITHIQATWLTCIIAFIVLDFAGYVVHALDHKINFFWNSHLVHHSSEEFNLACGLRQSISVFVRLFVILLFPAALLGVPSEVIAIVTPIHLFAQFWYHTKHIDKMGVLEKVIVTPSHHRVHHAINKEYIDKNFGQIFIFWDKMFGTFQEELKDVPPVYGITRPVRTWNPIKINFQHMSLLIQDAWRTKHWADKLRVFYKPTGWRPNDVEEKYPVFKIDDVYHFEKYNSGYSKGFYFFSWMQLFVLLGMVSYLFANIGAIGKPNMFYYAAIIFLFVYAFTESMDKSKHYWIWEFVKMMVGISMVIYLGDWFGLSKYLPLSNYWIIGYFVFSTIAILYFYSSEVKSGILKSNSVSI